MTNHGNIALPPGRWITRPNTAGIWRYQLAEPVNEWELIKHGTERGYQQHRYRNVDICEDCRDAHRIYELEARRLRRIKKKQAHADL